MLVRQLWCVNACVVWALMKWLEAEGSSIPALDRRAVSIIDPQHSFHHNPVPQRYSLPPSICLFASLLTRRGEEAPSVLSSHWSWSHRAGRYCHNPAVIDPTFSDYQGCFFFFFPLSLSVFLPFHLQALKWFHPFDYITLTTSMNTSDLVLTGLSIVNDRITRCYKRPG